MRLIPNSSHPIEHNLKYPPVLVIIIALLFFFLWRQFCNRRPSDSTRSLLAERRVSSRKSSDGWQIYIPPITKAPNQPQAFAPNSRALGTTATGRRELAIRARTDVPYLAKYKPVKMRGATGGLDHIEPLSLPPEKSSRRQRNRQRAGTEVPYSREQSMG